jgi:hypothetical protein
MKAPLVVGLLPGRLIMLLILLLCFHLRTLQNVPVGDVYCVHSHLSLHGIPSRRSRNLSTPDAQQALAFHLLVCALLFYPVEVRLFLMEAASPLARNL